MNDLIQRITNAIIKQEGMPDNWTNPGNLRAAPWIKTPVIHNDFWLPINRQQGIAGVAHCVALRIAMGQSLRQVISAWAPISDHNDTEQYIKNVKNWANVPDENAPLYNYL